MLDYFQKIRLTSALPLQALCKVNTFNLINFLFFFSLKELNMESKLETEGVRLKNIFFFGFIKRKRNLDEMETLEAAVVSILTRK